VLKIQSLRIYRTRGGRITLNIIVSKGLSLKKCTAGTGSKKTDRRRKIRGPPGNITEGSLRKMNVITSAETRESGGGRNASRPETRVREVGGVGLRGRGVKGGRHTRIQYSSNKNSTQRRVTISSDWADSKQ